ncbi:MAG: DNA repair protein RecN [Actinomycetota bacterium]
MLNELVVENLGVIERAELELVAGSSALTGETGAGKTLVVSALSLLLGGRADRTLIRHGASQARVEARFTLDAAHPARAALLAADLIDEDAVELVVSRSIAEGGGKVRIDGRLATVSTLAEIGPTLVEIAGQHEHQRITSAADQLLLVDLFSGPRALDLRREVSASVRAAAAAVRRAEELEAGERERERELDVVRFEAAEISAAALREGERDELIARAGVLEHAETIAEAIAATRAYLDDERGATGSVRQAADSLGRAAERDPALSGPTQRLLSAAVELEDVSLELARAMPSSDPEALEGIRERIGEIDRLRRKYGDTEAEILAYLDKASARLLELERATGDVEVARREAVAETERATELATELSSIRREAAPRLASEVNDILASLAMGSSTLEVGVTDAALYEGGLDTVELRVASTGHPSRPIGKIASGGELSRLALALRLATGRSAGFASTLVFDEVDAGVGGEAARAVGAALAELARSSGVQVVVVTHLPQVAAAADAHMRVVRVPAADGSASALVERLDGPARVEELSRMLAGLPDSETARDHAQELLDIAKSA